MNDFRDLEVWQRAMELQRATYALARALPIEERFELASQIRRASNSIVANIVEGHGQSTRANFRRFVGIARGSTRELHAHLLCIVSAGYASTDDLNAPLALVQRVGQMLTKLHHNLSG